MKTKLFFVARYGLLIMVVFVLVPIFFNMYPDYLLFSDVMATLGLCVMMKKGICEKKKICLEITFWLGLVMIMSNGWFRYERLLQVFPLLAKVSEATALCVGLGAIILTAFSAAIFRVWQVYACEKRPGEEEIDRLSEKEWGGSTGRSAEDVDYKAEAVVSEMKMAAMKGTSVDDISYSPGKYEEKRNVYEMPNAANDGDRPEYHEERYRGPIDRDHTFQLNFGLVIGGVIAVVAILALVGLILYFLVKNQDALEQIIEGDTIVLMLNCTTVLVITLLAVCGVAMIAFSILKTVGRLMGNVPDTDQKVEAGLDSVEGWLTALLSIFIFTFFGRKTMEDLIALMSGGKAVVIFLVGLVSLIVVVMFYHCVYKLLGSCIRRDGMIRRYADAITRKLAKSVLDLLERMADTVAKIPDLYEIMVDVVSKGMRRFMEYIFWEE